MRGFLFMTGGNVSAGKYLITFILGAALLMNGACATGQKRIPQSESQTAEVPEATISTSGEYILGAEDVIEVLVWRNEALSRTVSIRPDGKISLPIIGDLQAAGLTATELRDSIKEHLQEYKETPEVSVIIREVNSLAVFIMGEVARPGKLQLRSETTLLQALSLSGGFTQYADPNNILLLRREKGGETRIRVRYKDIVSGKNPDGNLLLRRGDTILVP
jgi:polysaccharide export outer membrane protein